MSLSPRLLLLPLFSFLVPGALLLHAPAAEAQAPQTADFTTSFGTGVGYSGVFPDAELGVSVYQFVTDRIGFFADAKTTLSSLRNDDEFCPVGLEVDCEESAILASTNPRATNRFADHEEYRLLNAGAIFAPTPGLAFMAGIGYARERRIVEFVDLFSDEEDEDNRITESGGYFVPGSPPTEEGIQGVFGILLRAGERLAVRVGYESAPGGMSAAVYLNF